MKQIKVKVRAMLDATGGVDFEVDGVKAKQARLKLDKGSGSHAIDFDLHDQTGRSLQFDGGDPIWASDNVPCPPPSGLHSQQLTIDKVSGKSLTVINANSGEPREIRYQLNFVDGSGSSCNCDPIVDNGGGNLL